MTHVLPDDLYRRFRDLVQQRIGLYYPEAKRSDLAHALQMALATSGLSSLNELYAAAQQQPATWDMLVAHLTVGETRFFRNPDHFAALRSHILPELIVQRRALRSLRLWSAGCATGEEPYSLAMLLSDLLPERANWHISILGTDINPAFLQRARDALYGAWSFRDTPDEVQQRFFLPDAGRWRLRPEIRQMVTFARLNLSEAAYPAITNGTCALDIIVCRNVTIYFNIETTRQIVERLYAALVPGGWLLVGHSEPHADLYHRFETHNFPGAILYRKPTDAPRFAFNPSTGTFTGDESVLQPEQFTPPKRAATAPLSAKNRTAPLSRRAAPTKPLSEHPPPASGERSRRPATRARTGVLSESSLATPSANADEDWKTLQHELARAPGVARATTLLQQFVQQHPNHSTAHAILARKLADQGQESAAHTHAEQALAADPLCVEATYLLAQIGEQRRDLDTALYYYRRVRYLDPNSVAGWLGLARIWQQLARPVEARRAYRSLLHVLDTLPATEPIPGLEHATVAEVSAFAHQQMALLQSQ